MCPASSRTAAVRRSLRRGRRTGTRAVAVAAVTVATMASAVAYQRGGPTPWAPTTVTASPPGTLTTLESYVDNTYNMGVWLDVKGPGAVEVVRAWADKASPGLEQREALIGWGCGGKEAYGAAVTDDARSLPNSDIRPLRDARVRESDDGCWYVLLRFVPRRTGTLNASGGRIEYRIGRRTLRKSFDFRTSFEVTEHGRDPRTKPAALRQR